MAWVKWRQHLQGSELLEWELEYDEDSQAVAQLVEVGLLDITEPNQMIQVYSSQQPKVLLIGFARHSAAKIVRLRIPGSFHEQPLSIQPITHVGVAIDRTNPKDFGMTI